MVAAGFSLRLLSTGSVTMDKNELYELLEWFDRSTLSEIVVEKSDTKVVMKKGGVLPGGPDAAPSAPPPLPPGAQIGRAHV